MSDNPMPMGAERLVSLGRAAVEARRFSSPEVEALDGVWQESLAAVPEEQQEEILREAETLLASAPESLSADAPLAEVQSKGPVQELMQKSAGLELKLQTEAARYAELEAASRREQADHQEAIESLSLQQKQIKELQETRTKLLENLNRVEADFRRQVNQTEQANLKYEKLKSSRQFIGDQVTEQTEQLNALKAQNEQLRQELAATRRDRDLGATEARQATDAAESRTAQAEFARLWARMHDDIPDVFVPTHVPNSQSFDRVCETLVEFVRVFATLEQHVHGMLKDLRQVGAEDDKLNRFYLILARNPGLVETLREYLASGKSKGNFANLLRAVQAWARAFGSGLYKVIVQSPSVVAEQLNYRSWPIKLGWGEEAAIGKYLKETAQRSVPEVLGTRFRKQAGDMAYDDYNTLMRRQR